MARRGHGYLRSMSDNTDYPTGALTDPAANREPADFEDPEAYDAADDPDADPDMLNPQDLRDDGERVEAHLAPDAGDDTDADPENLDPRDVR